MTQFIELETTNDGTILIEIDAGNEKIDGLIKAGCADKVEENVIKVCASLEGTIMKVMQRNAIAFSQAINAMSNPPAEAELSFGIKGTAEAGYSAIAKVSGEGNYAVRLLWKRESEEPKKE